MIALVLYLLGMYQEAKNVELLEALTGDEVAFKWKALLLIAWPAWELYRLAMDVFTKEEGDEEE